jgi:hypothetical protein
VRGVRVSVWCVDMGRLGGTYENTHHVETARGIYPGIYKRVLKNTDAGVGMLYD